MSPTILRFQIDAPDSAELRYYLRHAGALLAAADIESPARITVLRRARAWIVAGLCGVDHLLSTLAPAVPDPVTDRDTDAHDLSSLTIPNLAAGSFHAVPITAEDETSSERDA